MSIQTDLTRIKNAKAAIKAAIEGKGVTVPDATLLDGMAALIESIEAGGGGLGGDFEVSTGIITLSEDAESLSFDHGLSKAPSFVHIFLQPGYSVKTYANALRTMYYKFGFSGKPTNNFDAYTSRAQNSYFYHENSLTQNDVSFVVDDTTVTAPGCSFNGSAVRKWLSGKPYHWICIAGEAIFPYE